MQQAILGPDRRVSGAGGDIVILAPAGRHPILVLRNPIGNQRLSRGLQRRVFHAGGGQGGLEGPVSPVVEQGDADMTGGAEGVGHQRAFDEVDIVLGFRSLHSMRQIEVADLNFDRIFEERRPEAGIFQRDIGVADAADRAHRGGVAAADEIILELIFPDAAQPAFDLKTRLGEVRRLGKALLGHGRAAAVHIDAAAQVDAVRVIQRFDGKAVAQVDKERKRRDVRRRLS